MAVMPEVRKQPFTSGVSRAFLFQSSVLALVVLFVLIPIVLLLWQSFVTEVPGQPAQFSLQAWRNAFSTESFRLALWNTLQVAAVRQFISFAVAIPVAWILARTDIPGRRWLEFNFWIAFFLPTIPVVQAWVLLLDPDYGLINEALRNVPFLPSPLFDIYSFAGIIWVHIAHNSIAFKIMLLAPIFRTMDGSFEEAARIFGSTAAGTVWRIVLPIMAPGLIAVFLISTIYALQSFEIEQILGPPFRFSIFSTEVFTLINQERPDFSAATALSGVILVAVTPFILLDQWISRRNRFTTISGRFKTSKVSLGSWRYPAFIGILALGLLMTLLPIAVLLVGSFMKKFGFFGLPHPWTIMNWSRVLEDATFVNSLVESLRLGLSTAIVGMIAFSVIGYIVVRTHFVWRETLDFLTWLPSTVPGIILGLGLLLLFLGVPLLRPIYGSSAGMVVATFIATMTIGVQLIKSNLKQLGTELEEAGRVNGGGWWHVYRSVVLPLTLPVILITGVLSFSLAVRNVSGIVVLSSGSNRPMSLLQLDFIVEGLYESASVVGLILAFVTISVASFAWIVSSRYDLSSAHG